MPVRMLNFVTAPPPRRKFRHGSIVEQTAEYQDLVIALGAGLKPQEYVSVNFADSHEIRKELQDPIANLLFVVKRKIKELGLPYDAYVRSDTLYIVGRGVIS